MVKALTLAELIQHSPRLIEAAPQLRRNRPVDVEGFVRRWRAWFLSDRGCVWGYWHQQTLMGSLGAVLSEDLYDGLPIAVELFWNVRPEGRQQSGWRRLFSAYEQWAQARGARSVYLTHWEHSDPRMGRLFARYGFHCDERAYRKEL